MASRYQPEGGGGETPKRDPEFMDGYVLLKLFDPAIGSGGVLLAGTVVVLLDPNLPGTQTCNSFTTKGCINGAGGFTVAGGVVVGLGLSVLSGGVLIAMGGPLSWVISGVRGADGVVEEGTMEERERV